ncbi:MAG: Daunorubicin/doxorubicin resistance ATP-binding protein DrrA [Candidatus Bathyarchaeota archaeon B23]|nr:MAG: Daunorubicin/doxorubicin resistance ATP-binding protein DrrA [Candidatus Bathyarchaeota archaeon B23]
MDAIVVEELTKYYGDLCAVDHVSFNVRRGEVFGYLGPNGAGKTTTIRMLSGLTRPSEGRALISGYDVLTEAVEVKRRVGVVPEVSNLYDELTVWENLKFISRLYHVPRAEREGRIRELLEMFSLWDRRGKRFRRLSRGLKRRVILAAALVHDPEVLFLDEPTTGLDVVSARGLRSLVRELRGMGKTIFLTTHYIEEADQLCDRIAIIVRGRITALDAPEGLKSKAGARYVVEVELSREPPQGLLEALRRLGGVETEGLHLRLSTDRPQEVLRLLPEEASKAGLRLVSVRTRGITLEDAFLELTGLSPEVMRMEKGGG